MNYKSLHILILLALLTACGEDESEPKSVPTVATGPAVLMSNAFTIRGQITDTGNDMILATGIVYSTTTAVPTLNDSKVELTDGAKTFSVTLDELPYSTPYYVRAYATNRIGTGYSEVVPVTTGNAPPAATALSLTGEAHVGSVLTASYTYTDGENDPEGETKIEWLSAVATTGAGERLIAGATGLTYTVTDAEELRFIRFRITPVATAGTTTGTFVNSSYTSAIPEVKTLTFMYNGQEVTYGIIRSPLTNRKWLDRNLGAPDVASSVDDYENYGDLFQWGRGADGHQLVNRYGLEDADMVAENGTSPNQSSTTSPGHNKFIVTTGTPNGDWMNPQNNDLWKGVNGINNPCPGGWRVPTNADWLSEGIQNIDEGFALMRMTYTGVRELDGSFQKSKTHGAYAVATAIVDMAGLGFGTMHTYEPGNRVGYAQTRGTGMACRCIKD